MKICALIYAPAENVDEIEGQRIVSALNEHNDDRFSWTLKIILSCQSLNWVELDKYLLQSILDARRVQILDGRLRDFLTVRGKNNPLLFFYGADYFSELKGPITNERNYSFMEKMINMKCANYDMFLWESIFEELISRHKFDLIESLFTEETAPLRLRDGINDDFHEML